MTAGRGSKSSRAEIPSATDHQEIEWQFDAGELESVEGWLGQQYSGSSGLIVAPESTLEITDTYYDTDDWRFYRAGYALRVRNTDGEIEATMKSLTPAEGSLRRRREISEPLEDDKPATLKEAGGPVGGRSRTLVGRRELRQLFKIETRRQGFALLLDGSTDGSQGDVRIGEISLDASKIPLGDEPARLTRVEVEAGIGIAPTPDLHGFVDEMQSALELSPSSTSKYETGLYASGLDPEGDSDFGPTHIDPSMSLGEVAFAVLRRQFAEMRDHEPGTRLGEDPEELHDMRVPTRRMRAAMKVFQGALPERAGWLREELRWVAHALGDVRDLDVQIERLQAWKEEAGEETSRFLDKILTITHKRRAEARKNMLEVLDSTGTSVWSLRSRSCCAADPRPSWSPPRRTATKWQASRSRPRRRPWSQAATARGERRRNVSTGPRPPRPSTTHARRGSGCATPWSSSPKSTVNRCRSSSSLSRRCRTISATTRTP